MARNRMLKASIWTDEKLTECSVNAHHLFILCISQADDAGILCVKPKILHDLVYFGRAERPALESTEKALKELFSQFLLIPYEVDGTPYAFMPNWFSHQKINRPSPSKHPAPQKQFKEYSVNVQGIINEWFVNAHRLITERSSPKERKGIERNRKERNKDSLSELKLSDEVMNLTNLLISKILSNDPKAKIPPMPENGSQPDPRWVKWAKEADLLLRVDERPFKEAEQLVHWCQQNNFWKSNILSMAKFRQQYTQLRGKWKSEQEWQPEEKETEAERIRRLTGG